MTQNILDVLHACPLFSEVPEAGFGRLAAIGVLRRFHKGERIFREGEDCPGVYVVGKGLVRVYKSAPGGKEHVLHMVGPGQTFAEVAAIGRFEMPASAEAVEPTLCALLPSGPFRRALEEDHELCLGMMGGLTLWVRHLVGLMEGVVLRDAAGRLARYLVELPPAEDGTLELPALKRHVASHLNLTSETLSRTLRRLVESGLIAEPENNRVRILDPDRLRMTAEGKFPRV